MPEPGYKNIAVLCIYVIIKKKLKQCRGLVRVLIKVKPTFWRSSYVLSWSQMKLNKLISSFGDTFLFVHFYDGFNS